MVTSKLDQKHTCKYMLRFYPTNLSRFPSKALVRVGFTLKYLR